MKNPILIILLFCGSLLAGCHKPAHVVSATTEGIAIDASLDSIQDTLYCASIEGINEALNRELDIVIGYAPEALEIYQPECPMLNWATDVIYDAACRVYPGHVDFAVTNIGGLRTPWNAGDITKRHVFELMPFDNLLVILTLSGEDVIELCQVFAEDGGQGVSGLRMIAEDRQLADVTIGGKPVVKDAYYHVATSDYLAGGRDHMTSLTHATELYKTDCLLRDIYLDYITEHKTVAAKIDGRMTIL